MKGGKGDGPQQIASEGWIHKFTELKTLLKGLVRSDREAGKEGEGVSFDALGGVA